MSDEADENRRHSIGLVLPEDCAFVTSELVAITYVRNDGAQGYAVVTRGDMPMTTYLGLCALAEHYILGWGQGGDE